MGSHYSECNSVTELGYKVKPTDDVRYDGKRLKAETGVHHPLEQTQIYHPQRTIPRNATR